MTYKAKSAYIDTKSVDKATFPHSLIEPHQALPMLRHELEGAITGYIVWLKKTNKVIHIPSRVLCMAMQKTGSIDHTTDGVKDLGTMADLNMKAIFQ